MRLYVDDDDDAKSYYVTGEALFLFFFRWKTTAATKWGDPFRRGYYIRHFGVGWFLPIDCLNEKYRFEKCVIIFLVVVVVIVTFQDRFDPDCRHDDFERKGLLPSCVVFKSACFFFRNVCFSWLLAYLESWWKMLKSSTNRHRSVSVCVDFFFYLIFSGILLLILRWLVVGLACLWGTHTSAYRFSCLATCRYSCLYRHTQRGTAPPVWEIVVDK
jgi:hypothetical protein